MLSEHDCEVAAVCANLCLETWRKARNDRPGYEANNLSHGCVEAAKAIAKHFRLGLEVDPLDGKLTRYFPEQGVGWDTVDEEQAHCPDCGGGVHARGCGR
jgi:hypothetical protein